MKLLDVSEGRRVWFDVPGDALHLTSPWAYQRLTAWPRVRSWQIERGGRWVRARRPLALDLSQAPRLSGEAPRQQRFAFASPRLLFGTDALDRFRQRIPPAVLSAVAALPEGHGAMLEFVSGGPACLDLLVANPALAALLVSRWDVDGVSWAGVIEETTTLVNAGVRQRDLLARYDAPATDAWPRLLRKIPARCLDRDTVQILSSVVGEPEALERLRHLPVVTVPVLQVAASYLSLVTDRFLRELLALDLAQAERGEGAWPLPADVVEMELAAVDELWTEQRGDEPLRIDSIARLHQHLADLMGRTRQPALEARSAEPLPQPPFPGTEAIVPLTTIGDLVAESLQQRHCVATYVKQVLAGRVAVYRVQRPERATLSLRRFDAAWDVDELRGPENGPVDLDTRRAVVDWLRAARADLAASGSDVSPDVAALRGPRQEARVRQSLEDGAAGVAVEAEQPLRLGQRG